MGILDFFNKEKRERAKAIRDYDACRKHRELKILQFRVKAAEDIKFQYPESYILMNHHSSEFLVLSRSSRELLCGVFADDYYCKIKYLDDKASTSQIVAEVASYSRKIKSVNSCICSDELKRFKEAYLFIAQGVPNSIQAYGYAIFREVELEYIYGGALFLNDQRIAFATLRQRQSKSYFSKALHMHAIQGKSTRNGISCLEFVAGWSGPCGDGTEYRYDLLFDNRNDYTKITDNNIYRKYLDDLNAFLYAIEDEFMDDVKDLSFVPEDNLSFIPRKDVPKL